MANPPNAIIVPRPISPNDTEHFTLTLTRGSTGVELLNPGENVASFEASVTAEGAAAGLEMLDGGGYSTTIEDLTLSFWATVNPANQVDPAFTGAGLSLGIEFTFTTDATPPRVKQKTVVIQVAKQ